MRRLGIYLSILIGAILLTPILIDQLFLFLFLGKIPFTNISLPATLMIIFWTAIIPLVIIFKKSATAFAWKLIDIAGEITQRRINRTIHRFTPNRTNELILLSIYLLSEIKESEPNSNLESQKLAPSLT